MIDFEWVSPAALGVSSSMLGTPKAADHAHPGQTITERTQMLAEGVRSVRLTTAPNR